MAIVTIDLDEETNAALVTSAAKAGTRPEQLAAELLRDALTGLGDADVATLQTKRALVGPLVDRSPWNNSIDCEWDNYKP